MVPKHDFRDYEQYVCFRAVLFRMVSKRSAPAINITITGNVVREETDITKIANQVAQRIADELQRKTQLRGG